MKDVGAFAAAALLAPPQVQAPREQLAPAGRIVPQPPQLFESVEVSARRRRAQ